MISLVSIVSIVLLKWKNVDESFEIYCKDCDKPIEGDIMGFYKGIGRAIHLSQCREEKQVPRVIICGDVYSFERCIKIRRTTAYLLAAQNKLIPYNRSY